jgi:hypothetical protein
VNYQRAWGRFVAEQLCLVSSIGRGDAVEIHADAAPIEYLGARARRETADGAGDGSQ